MNREGSALLTDLYQLTMLQSYYRQGMTADATFEFFVYQLPPRRNFLLAAGLEQVIRFLESFRFSGEECQWLRDTGRFDAEFIDILGQMRFTGEVHAPPEGTVFFAMEPVIRITAPLPEAQIIETRLINLIHYQTLIASKAVRSVITAPGKLLLDFGLRRAHGAEAGLLAARASYLAGFDGTSNVLAGKEFGIPMYGTMAHSYIMAHEDESKAFERFTETQCDNLVMLIDTYDTEAAAAKLVELNTTLTKRGITIKGVRLDSGDLAAHANKVRQILDDGGLHDTHIFSSGDLDEYKLRTLQDSGAPIDGFGIGTRMITSADAPYLNCAYKLQEYAGKPRRKWSEGKQNWPGKKQVYRVHDAHGLMQHDVLTDLEDPQQGQALLIPVMKDGRRLSPGEPLASIRERVSQQLMQLPAALRSIDTVSDYPVIISERLRQMAMTVKPG